MPATRKVQSQATKKVDRHSPERRRWTRSIVAIVLGIAAFCVIIFFLIGGPARIEKAKFESYLNDKYGQTFIVENVRETGVSIGGKGSWVAEAHPESDQALKFRIERSQTTNKISVDTFLQTLWSSQGSNEIESFLSKEIPDYESYYLEITPGSPGNALYDSIEGITPSLSTVLKKDRDKISYSLSVRNVTESPGRSEPPQAQLNNAFKVMTFVRSKDIPLATASYVYREKSFEVRDKTGQQEYQYGIRVENEALRDINNVSDLRKYFKVLEK